MPLNADGVDDEGKHIKPRYHAQISPAKAWDISRATGGGWVKESMKNKESKFSLLLVKEW